MGLAMGVIGLSRSDFLALTPFEFNRIVKSWSEHKEMIRREQWEQKRFLALKLLTPYAAKKDLKPTDVARFSWDAPENKERPTQEYFENIEKKYGG